MIIKATKSTASNAHTIYSVIFSFWFIKRSIFAGTVKRCAAKLLQS